MNYEIRAILESLKNGKLSVDEADTLLSNSPYVNIGYAMPDLNRKIRQGCSEVIYGEGKSTEQIIGIMNTLIERGEERILITRLSREKAVLIMEAHRIHYDELSKLAMYGEKPKPDGNGTIMIATGGTSDMAVAEEAALTAEMLGNEVIRLYDVGVAGIHRLLNNAQLLSEANVIVAIAGMEGALASVIGGLTSAPVIAVPTSVGYGASFQGLSAMLGMLNSCAPGVCVVNIDNGFGAGFLASRINHMNQKPSGPKEDL